MISKPLEEVLKRASLWPADVQEEFAKVALEVDRNLGPETYRATDEELDGIDRGLTDADGGRFAAPSVVEAILRKFRRA